jgi:integrase
MITSYVTHDGETLFKVRVFLKARNNPTLRVTQQKGGIKTLSLAKKEEDRLWRECEKELHSLEMRGVLFCDLVDEWYEHELMTKVATGERSKISHDDNFGSLKKWFGDYLRGPAVDLNPYVVLGIFQKMKESGISMVHRRKMKHVLKSVFDFGIQTGQLPTLQRSPTFEVILKKEEEKKPEILSIVEIQKLIQGAYAENHEWRRIWAIALLTGMRSGELYALTWKDIDWENKLISVNKSYNCRMRSIKSTKAGYWRQVPISSELEKVLREQQRETADGMHVFPRMWKWDLGQQAEVLRKFCYLHGLPSIKFHTLRACFATQMLRQGVEAARVMKICGWKELKTMQHYVRLAGIEIQGVTERLKIFTDLEQATKEITGGGGITPSPLLTSKVD